jgi:hypothetical protein
MTNTFVQWTAFKADCTSILEVSGGETLVNTLE